MKWYFVRHGEILSNRQRVYAGWNNELLTATGIRQAETAAEELAGLPLVAIYSSPLQRAMQTASIIGNTIGLEPIPEEGFIEMRLGPWEGMSEEAVAEQYPEEWRTWNEHPAQLNLPGRETLAQLLDRLHATLERIRTLVSDEAVLVVTHVAIIRVLALWATGRSLDAYKSIEVPNCGIFPIEGL